MSTDNKWNATATFKQACENQGISVDKYTTKHAVWAEQGAEAYGPVASATPTLPSGFYKVIRTQREILLQRTQNLSDEIIRTPGNNQANILTKEISQFWAKADIFKQHGFLHRRGYLLHGKQGTGKSLLVKSIVEDLVKSHQGIAIDVTSVDLLTIGVGMVRMMEPERPLICIFEDIERHAEYDEEDLLAFLDGADQTEHIINIATTNYMDKLAKRITQRPRRFDRIIEIEAPSETMRAEFLKRKMNITDDAELAELVEVSKDFTFAALTDLVISTKCLGKPVDKAAQSLKTLLQIQSF